MAWKPPQRAGATVFVWSGYSIAERDRRWRAVRESAAKAGFDCIFVPLGNGTDGRYLTQLRCSSIVLPTDGRPPIIIADRSSRNEWVPEPWQTSREWAEPMSEALLEAGMERARIGVVGLKGGKVTHVRAFDGVVNHTAIAAVKRRLPNATFEDATDVVGFVRYVKSEEEIGYLRHSAAIAEAGIEEMIKLARPGFDAAVLYAAVMERMLELGSEYYPLALYADPIDTSEPRRYTNPPIGKRLEKSTLITNEVSAVWGAQVSQEDQPILLGHIPDEWKPVINLQREVFEAGLGFMRPGTSFGELIDFINSFGAKRGMKTLILMHGRGYGDDGPLLSPRLRGELVRDVRIEKGNAWVWKPYAMTADERIQFVWGGDVIVTEKGGEALFKRPHGMVSVT
ncbi:MAG: M24 family metallopeptidase [bacterium]